MDLRTPTSSGKDYFSCPHFSFMFESVHSTGCVVPLLIAYFVPEGQQHSDVMMKGQEKMGLDYILRGVKRSTYIPMPSGTLTTRAGYGYCSSFVAVFIK